jgi:integrase
MNVQNSLDSLKDAIYDTDNKLKLYEGYLFNSKDVLEKNKAHFRRFIDSCEAEGLSKHRIMTYYRMLRIIGRNSDFILDKKATKEDIERLMRAVRKLNYSPYSVETVKAILKKYYRWLFGLSSNDSLPDCVKWIKGETPPQELKKEDLLTEEEVGRIISASNSIMGRALVSVFYEGALRPLELLSMRIRDITFGPQDIKVYVRGKMKKKQGDRAIFLIRSCPLLKEWIEHHPFNKDPDYPVWIINKNQAYKDKKLFGNPLSSIAFYRLIAKLVKKAQIERKVWPYLFRHSRATQLYKELGEAMAKKFLGHSPDSRMARVYNHLNEEDVRDALLQNHGIKKREQVSDSLTCQRCGHINRYGALLCSHCGMALTTDTAIRFDVDVLPRLMRLADMVDSSPEIMKIIESPEWQKRQAERMAKEMVK